MAQVETRELQYFVAVAEELHFGRAAQRLGMAQPPLSRAIQRLERRLGATLLERSSRGVALTRAGEVLLREGRAALAAVSAAERRTRRAAGADGRPGLVLVTKAGASVELLAKLLDAYAAEPGAVPVHLLLCGTGEQEGILRDGRADVALLHLPFDSTAGLDTEVLQDEGQVAVLPAGHPLSSRDRVELSEVEALTDAPLRFPAPAGAGPDVGIHGSTELFQLVGLGRASAVLPESVRLQLGSEHAVVPVVDAPRVTTVIAWPPHSTSLSLAALVRTATRL